jgi:hypothetical protein
MSRGRRRQFGSIRRRDSGMYQASYPSPDGRRVAIGTFRTKVEAGQRLAEIETQDSPRNVDRPQRVIQNYHGCCKSVAGEQSTQTREHLCQ